MPLERLPGFDAWKTTPEEPISDKRLIEYAQCQGCGFDVRAEELAMWGGKELCPECGLDYVQSRSVDCPDCGSTVMSLADHRVTFPSCGGKKP